MARIVYSGNFEPVHSTENHVAAELTALGHTVIAVQENRATEAEAYAAALGRPAADLFLVTRSWGWEPAEWLRPLIDYCRESGQPRTAGFHLDRFWGLGEDRTRRVETDPMFRTDTVFTADGDDDPAFAALGINHVWLPPGVYTPEAIDCDPLTPDDPQEGAARICQAQVAFVGSRGYHPEWPHRPEMIDRLRSWYGDRFVHVGGDGDVPTTRNLALNRVYATVPVIVGDSCFAFSDARYWSDRFPETWGRGGYLVYPEIDALQAEIVAQATVPYPSWRLGDWDDLRMTIDDALADAYHRDHTRELIAGYVRSAHTYRARLSYLLDKMGVH